jgi:hypothetical protein
LNQLKKTREGEFTNNENCQNRDKFQREHCQKKFVFRVQRKNAENLSSFIAYKGFEKSF